MVKVSQFKNNTKKENDCWIWQKCCGNDGYGQIKLNGKTERAHRIAYLLYKGEIPEGKLVCHTCDNRKCVNPDHLWIGNSRQNNIDCIMKGRRPSRKGERHPLSKLTEEKVLSIKKEWKNGKMNQREISEKFGIHQSTVSYLVRGKRWNHVSV